ncbi:MAG: 50S ribosomal protein L13 [Deltaproteobacteria bacterium]|nr:50S ribosomal protein L13 [Deltaproteobacteria bacterium]MCX7953383.1 50S ribosomal protein L13 [Deltaproteobacteria bacterium]
MVEEFKTSFQRPTTASYFLIDADGLSLGRVSSMIAKVLLGKNSPSYAPFFIADNFVYVINADKVVLTGNKSKEPVYLHSLHIGGLRSCSRGSLGKKLLLERAVSKMLPKNRLRKRLLKRLKIIEGNRLPSNIKHFEVMEVR